MSWLWFVCFFFSVRQKSHFPKNQGIIFPLPSPEILGDHDLDPQHSAHGCPTDEPGPGKGGREGDISEHLLWAETC